MNPVILAEPKNRNDRETMIRYEMALQAILEVPVSHGGIMKSIASKALSISEE